MVDVRDYRDLLEMEEMVGVAKKRLLRHWKQKH